MSQPLPNERKVNLGFAHGEFPAGMHICYMTSSKHDRNSLAAQFLNAGYQSNEKVAYIVEGEDSEQRYEQLKHAGAEFPADVVVSTQTTYYPDGKFDPDSMVHYLENFASQGGACGCRATGEMTWALKGVPGSERLLEYEARLTPICEKHGITGICQYDTTQFDGATIWAIMQTHPYIIVGRQLIRNAVYRNPEDFLRDLAGH